MRKEDHLVRIWINYFLVTQDEDHAHTVSNKFATLDVSNLITDIFCV